MKIINMSKWQLLLLSIILISLLSCSLAGCKTPAPAPSPEPVLTRVQQEPFISSPSTVLMVPYVNKLWGYTVYFPQDWYIENDVNSDDRGILDFHAPEPYHGTLSIEVVDIEKTGLEPDIEMLAQQSLEDTKSLWGEIVLQENERLNNSWDWYFTFDGVLWNLGCYVQVYLKQTDGLLYTLTLRTIKGEHDEDYIYNLNKIPEAIEFY
jgi:hypothetical protein